MNTILVSAVCVHAQDLKELDIVLAYRMDVHENGKATR